VLHEYRTTPHYRRRNRILVRTHSHRLTPLAAEFTGSSRFWSVAMTHEKAITGYERCSALRLVSLPGRKAF
jgi:hypothetical protein